MSKDIHVLFVIDNDAFVGHASIIDHISNYYREHISPIMTDWPMLTRPYVVHESHNDNGLEWNDSITHAFESMGLSVLPIWPTAAVMHLNRIPEMQVVLLWNGDNSAIRDILLHAKHHQVFDSVLIEQSSFEDGDEGIQDPVSDSILFAE